LNIPARFGIITIAIDMAVSGEPHSPASNRLMPQFGAGHAKKDYFASKMTFFEHFGP